MRPAWVIAARRTPITRLDGDLGTVSAEALGAAVVRELIADVGLDPAAVDDVIVACAAGPGGNLARRVVLEAGLPVSVPGLTVDRQCGGGLDAIVLACRLIESGAADVVVAGGVESASTSPLRGDESSDTGAGGRRFFPRRAFAGGGHADPGMAESAEQIAAEFGVSRERQDALAAQSHARAVAAQQAGHFDAEIVPVAGVSRDTCPRPTLTAERLARFPALVTRAGTVTAGNASQIADGAAFAVVVSQDVATTLGIAGLVHMGSVTTGVDPALCGMGGVAAVQALAGRLPALRVGEVDEVAITEAFASQTIATIDALGVDPGRVNPYGGAIGLGHPWGASGGIQVVRLFHDLTRTAGAQGLAVTAIAGGMGTAAWFRAGTPR